MRVQANMFSWSHLCKRSLLFHYSSDWWRGLVKVSGPGLFFRPPLHVKTLDVLQTLESRSESVFENTLLPFAGRPKW